MTAIPPEHDLVIRGATVVSPAGPMALDVAITGETISALVAQGARLGAAEEIDAAGLVLVPGGVDPHVHFENPSWETATAHDFALGTEAAALGGTTTVIDFAFQLPGELPLEALERRRAVADPKVYVDYSLHGTVTDATVEAIRQVPAMVEAGYPSVKVFMAYGLAGWRCPDGELLDVMRGLRSAGGILLVHAENDFLIERARAACVEAGDLAAGAHARSRPAVAEVEAIRRVLTFAEATGCPTFVVHVSTGAGVDAIQEARRRGAPAFAETCPHYLSFDASALDGEHGERYVMSPPLRSAEDRHALWRAMIDGRLESVGSDDAAYTAADKERDTADFRAIPNGVPGVQARNHVLFSAVVDGRLTLERFVAATAVQPARRFHLWPRKGALMPGADADLALWDPTVLIRGDQGLIHTSIGYTCYEDVEFRGRPVKVWSRGRRVVDDAKLCAAAGGGRFLHRAARSLG